MSGGYPCCCQQAGPSGLQPSGAGADVGDDEFVPCSLCQASLGPVALCVNISGIEPTGCCARTYNGRVYLNHRTEFGPVPDCHFVGADIAAQPGDQCAAGAIAYTSGCVWHCPIEPDAACALGEDGEVYAVLFKDQTTGVYHLRVAIGHHHSGDKSILWGRSFGASAPDCTAFDGLSLALISDNNTVCDASASGVSVSAVNLAAQDWFCCQWAPGSPFGCCLGKRPQRVQLVIQQIKPDPGSPDNPDCNPLNGTWILDSILDRQRYGHTGDCNWGIKIHPPLQLVPGGFAYDRLEYHVIADVTGTGAAITKHKVILRVTSDFTGHQMAVGDGFFSGQANSCEDCTLWDGLELAWKMGHDLVPCFFGDATISVTALSDECLGGGGGGPGDPPKELCGLCGTEGIETPEKVTLTVAGVTDLACAKCDEQANKQYTLRYQGVLAAGSVLVPFRNSPSIVVPLEDDNACIWFVVPTKESDFNNAQDGCGFVGCIMLSAKSVGGQIQLRSTAWGILHDASGPDSRNYRLVWKGTAALGSCDFSGVVLQRDSSQGACNLPAGATVTIA